MLPDLTHENMDSEAIAKFTSALVKGEKDVVQLLHEMLENRPALAQYLGVVKLYVVSSFGEEDAVKVFYEVVKALIPLVKSWDLWYARELEKKALEEGPWGELYGDDRSKGE